MSAHIIPDDIAAILRPGVAIGHFCSGPMRHDVYVGAKVVRTYRDEHTAGRMVWMLRQRVARMGEGLAA